MTFFLRRAIPIAIAVAVCACGETTTSVPSGPFAPGITGAPLAGRLEVIVIDEATGELVPRAEIRVGASSAPFATHDAPGHVVVEDAQATRAIEIEVVMGDGWRRSTRWIGVASDRVVIPVSRASGRALEGRVEGADTLGAAEVVAGPLEAPRFTDFGALDRAVPVACAPSADGACRFSGIASERTSRAAATVRDASGAAIAFGVGDVSADGTIDISLLDASMRAPAIALGLGSPLPVPPLGLDAVVGVPGLATAEGIGFLPQTPAADGTVAVPELSGALADASWWVLLEARSSDGSARSVVVQRSIREPSAVGAFAAFLALPEIVITGDVVGVGEVAGATTFVVECSDGAAAIQTTLVLGASGGDFDASACATMRVRAIDAPGASGTALDLDAAERTVQRFSETTFAP